MPLLPVNRPLTRGHALLSELRDSWTGSDAALARSLGLSKSTLSRILNPKLRQIPTVTTAVKLLSSAAIPVQSWAEVVLVDK